MGLGSLLSPETMFAELCKGSLDHSLHLLNVDVAQFVGANPFAARERSSFLRAEGDEQVKPESGMSTMACL